MALAILRKIGLSEGEATVYTALLEAGRSPLSRIHERTGIERRNIYDILNKLIERGLVTYVTENRRRFFQAGHPSTLVGYLDAKGDELERTKRAVQKELPSLVGTFLAKRPAVSAEIFRGHDGMKAAWEDILREKEIRFIGSGRYVPKTLPRFFRSWNARRIARRMKLFNLVRAELRKEIRKPYPLEYIRYLPPEFSGNPAVVAIYGNKTTLLLLGTEFFAFVIESKELADNYRDYFRFLWSNVAKR
ncbi:MAG: hypothetical protein HY369_05215 [Candidatus Aenigmarchaeota archaeon]|nr:hypothetical protein [Candidatus Aenigmarchaeota archaeon]